MARCLNCSAPLPDNSPVCTYCGTHNDVDFNAVSAFTVAKPQAERTCPICAVPLQTIDIATGQHYYIERCQRCFGLFFDPGELDALLATTVTNVFTIDTQRLNEIMNSGPPCEDIVTYKKCPVCSKLMNRVNFGARSGVVVDTCKDHGIWLDGGELRRLMEWRKAGGQLYHEQVEQDKEKQDQEREKRQAQQLAHMRSEAPITMGVGYDSDHDLLNTFSKVLGKLFQ